MSIRRPAVAGLFYPADPDQLRRLLSNLLVNAMQFTPPGGSVALQVQLQGHQVMVVVDDEGPGIPAAQRRLVFERFWQADRSSDGAGLGLGIAKGIVEAHRGSIAVESVLGHGTTFHVRLPCSEAAPHG